MSVNTDHTDDDDEPPPEATDGGTAPGDGDEWKPVPAEGRESTVRVRWSDLAALRARIDDLEDENGKLRAERDRLEAELAATKRGSEATIRRYERLLENRTGTPRRTDDDGDGSDESADRGAIGRLLDAIRASVR